MPGGIRTWSASARRTAAACPQGLGRIGVRREAAPIVGPEARQGGEVVALVERPSTIANGHLEHARCLCRPPTVIRASLPPALDRICLRCLGREPEGRYARASELADELRGV